MAQSHRTARIRDALLPALLAMLLLFGQLGAQMHEVSHLVPNAVAGAPDDKSLPHTAPCDQCLAYAQLGSALHSTPPVLPPGPAAFLPTTTDAESFVPVAALPYLARAPPFLV